MTDQTDDRAGDHDASDGSATEPAAADLTKIAPPELPEGQAPEITTPVLSDSRRDATEAVTWPIRVGAAWTWRLLVLVLGVYVALRMIEKVELVAFSLIIALFLTAVLHPLERRFRRVIPGPKSLPAALSLLVGVAFIGLIAWFVTWQITTNSGELANSITDFVDKTKNWLKTGPLHLKQADFDNLTKNISKTVQEHQSELISGAVKTVSTVVELAASALLIVLATFFFLRDGELIWKWFYGLMPKAAHERVDHAGRLGWRTLGGYMRGVLLIALFHGTAITILLEVLRVPLAPALGVLIFLGSFVPLIGLTVTGALCVAVTLLEHGLTTAIIVAVAIIVLVQVEGHVLQPMIMSRTVEVHPLAVAVSVLAGTAVAGIGGALIAVPLVAFLNTTIRAMRLPAGEEPAPDDGLVEEKTTPGLNLLSE